MAVNNHKGFTLIEVLVAFSILSLTLASVFVLLSSGSRNARISDEYSQAIVFAESKMAELGVTEELHLGLSRGLFNSSYQWEMRVSKRDRADLDPHADYAWDVFDVNMQVRWLSMGAEHELTLSTIRLVERG